jgi:phosphate transport system substrate-binding protein
MESLTVESGLSRVPVRRLVVILLVGVVLSVLVYYAPAFFLKEDKSPPVNRLRAGGTSSVDLMIQNRWRNAYRKEKGVELDYDSIGSTAGIKRMIDKDLAVSFTHAPMTEEQRANAQAKGGDVLHIPVVLFAAVPIYNLKELRGKAPLKFTGEVLFDIFLGKIVRWNDPALRKLNDNVDLPDKKIVVVHREDSSGTTFIFSDYLSRASDEWREKIGPGSSEIKWPVGEGKSRNPGVAYYVMDTDGAIGYVDLIFATLPDLQLQYGAVENKDKTAFIHAAPENMTAALKGMPAGTSESLTFNLTNQPGKDAYPISGLIYALCYQVQPALLKQKVVDFLHWVTHEGQQFAAGMTYAPLTPELAERAEQKINSIKAGP